MFRRWITWTCNEMFAYVFYVRWLLNAMCGEPLIGANLWRWSREAVIDEGDLPVVPHAHGPLRWPFQFSLLNMIMTDQLQFMMCPTKNKHVNYSLQWLRKVSEGHNFITCKWLKHSPKASIQLTWWCKPSTAFTVKTQCTICVERLKRSLGPSSCKMVMTAHMPEELCWHGPADWPLGS